MNAPISEPINEPTDGPINEPINRPINESTNGPTNRPVNRPDGLGFGYESDASASFLVVTGTDGAQEYQCRMLARNSVRCLIPPERMVKDGLTCFYYNITSKVPLSIYLKRKKFSKPEFLKFIFDVASAVNDSYGYLLNSSNFVFRQDHIYICPDTLEPSLIYVPAHKGGESCEALKGFVSELLLQHIQVEGFDSGNIVQRILSAVKSEGFNLKGFVKLMSELLYGGNCETPKDTVIPDAPVKREAGSYAEAAAIAGANKNIDRAGVGRKTEKNESPAGRQIPMPAIFAVMLQFIMALAIYLCRGLIDKAGANHTANYAAVLMIVVAIDVLVFKKVLAAGRSGFKTKNGGAGEKDKVVGEGGLKAEFKVNGKPAANKPEITEPGAEVVKKQACKAEQLKPETWPNKHEPTGLETSKAETSKPETSKAETSKAESSKPEAYALKFKQSKPEHRAPMPESLGPQGVRPGIAKPEVTRFSNKTELLGRPAKGVRVLKSAGKRAEEGDIVLDRDDFIIGRLSGHVDHVLNNNAVGKLHAELLNRNGVSYVKDLNSMNGTFINNNRIESNKEYELRTNDLLRLANSEYIFTYSD